MNRRLMEEPRLEGVAPAHMLRDDFTALDAKTTLRCAYDIEQLLLMQSIEGHAHAGHGLFYGQKFPNTTIDDVARSLRLDPAVVKADRQLLIDEIKDFAARAASGEKIKTASNADGEPLMRCGILRFIEIDPVGVLKGLYIGGLRDDPLIRKLANERYGVQIGYGESRLVDQRVLKKLGLTGFDLAKGAHENEVVDFEDAGLFAKNGDGNVSYMYIRYQIGPGASDDAAIVIAGKMHGISAAVGCFLADAIDTLEKYVPEYSDQDSVISEYIKDIYPGLGLSVDDSVDLTYLCSIPKEMEGKVPDSSLRHLLQVEGKLDQSTIESHFAYIAGNPYSAMVMEHGKCTNLEFYDYIESRLASFKPVR